MTKVWKSDGPETRYIEKLFREGILNSDSRPGVVQPKYPIFNGFSSAVFRKHFGLAKEKCCQNSSTSYGDLTINDLFADKEPLEELDGVDGPPEKMSKKCAQAQSENNKFIKFVQAPVVPCVFIDTVTKQDKCLVVFMLYSGITDINFDVIMKDSGPEQKLVVTYDWPTPMYDIVSMFKRDRDNTMLAENTDPKVLAVENALKEYRGHMEDAPVASIEIDLPVVVNMDPNMWTKMCNKKNDGGAVIFIELQCTRKNYIIAKNQKCLKIE